MVLDPGSARSMGTVTVPHRQSGAQYGMSGRSASGDRDEADAGEPAAEALVAGPMAVPADVLGLIDADALGPLDPHAVRTMTTLAIAMDRRHWVRIA